jgi:hypothetical protein
VGWLAGWLPHRAVPQLTPQPSGRGVIVSRVLGRTLRTGNAVRFPQAPWVRGLPRGRTHPPLVTTPPFRLLPPLVFPSGCDDARQRLDDTHPLGARLRWALLPPSGLCNSLFVSHGFPIGYQYEPFPLRLHRDGGQPRPASHRLLVLASRSEPLRERCCWLAHDCFIPSRVAPHTAPSYRRPWLFPWRLGNPPLSLGGNRDGR